MPVHNRVVKVLLGSASRRCFAEGALYAPSLKAAEECVFTVAIAAHMQKVHSVPFLTAKHIRVERTGCSAAAGESAGRLLCDSKRSLSDETTSCVLFGFKSFIEDVDFSNCSDFLLLCGRFDRLCWQLVFGTVFSE